MNIGTLIEATPGVYGGRPCLAGTRMPVRKIAIMANAWGMSAQQILKELPHLDLARIHAALAYYYADKAEIEADIEADERFGEEMAARYTHGAGPRDDLPPELLETLTREPGPFFDVGTLIESKSDVLGGRPHLAGTGTPVSTVANMSVQGLAPEDIRGELPHSDMARIHAALAYYHANKAHVDVGTGEERRARGEAAKNLRWPPDSAA